MSWSKENLPQPDAAPQSAALPAAEPHLDAAEPPAVPLLREDEPILFRTWTQPPPPSQIRIPHLGHLALLAGILAAGWICTIALVGLALFLRLFFRQLHVTTYSQAIQEVHYLLAGMAILYLSSLLIAVYLFPKFWDKPLFAGLHWRGRTALKKRFNLVFAAFACIGLAIANMLLMPGPQHTPVERLFQSTSGAWMMFAFGISFAPFFEEIAFRGFLLPALCTAFDWIGEKIHRCQPAALDSAGHPIWSPTAQIAASLCTSLPFALLHGEQTAYSLGPFLLLVCVSLVLCWTRLKTRSLAASSLVHAAYNFLLFSLMAIGTGGFRHFDKM